MSSSGQAPNVSMDDLLASIKSMIEGESSGEASSQAGSHIDTAAGMNPGGDDMQGGTPPSDALDDGIMDLTQVVSQPVVTDPSAGNPLLSDPSLNDPSINDPMANNGGNPALRADVPSDSFVASETTGLPDMGGQAPLAQGQISQRQVPQGQAPQNQAQQIQVNQEQVQLAQQGQMSQNQGQAREMQAPAVMEGQQAGQSAQDAAAQLDDIFSGMGSDKDSSGFSNMGGDIGLPVGQAPDPMGQAASNMMQNDSPVQPLSGQIPGLADSGEQSVVPLDQGGPQFNGADGRQMTPESGVPHPGFQSSFEAQGAPLGQEGLAQQQAHGQLAQEQNQVQNQGQYLGQPQGQERTEPLGGHDPRLENEIAMEQALSQADASLNLSNSHLNNPQMNQQPQMQQQQAHMRGMQPNMMQPMPGQQPGQVPMQQGQAPQGQVSQSQISQGQAPQGHMPQGQIPQQIPQQGQMQQGQMGLMQMGAQGGSDMLPVPSGFRPVLPAVQEQVPMAMNPMSDQLPVEMKNNLEEIVKQLLKPLLREWLERNLPELLKGVVDEETGKIDPNKW